MVTFMEENYHLLKRRTKKDGSYVYYVGVLGNELDKRGRRKYAVVRSLKTANKALARKRAAEVFNDEGLRSSTDNVGEFLKRFWTPGQSEYLRGKATEGREVSPDYAANSKALIEHYFLPYLEANGVTALNQLDRRTLYAWRDDLFARREKLKREDGTTYSISAATINKVRQAVNVALEWAVDMEMLPANPMARVKRVAEKPAQRAIFEREHLKLLFKTPWADYRTYAAAMLAVTTGMRLGEIRGLQSPALHLDDGYLDVVTNWVDAEGLKPPKWDSIRYGVPLPARCIETLRKLETMNPHESTDRFVFWSDGPREPIAKHRIQRDLRARMKVCKIPEKGRTFHSLRHTYVSLMRHEVGTERVMLAVGHTSTATTDGYTHESADDRKLMQKAAEGLL